MDTHVYLATLLHAKTTLQSKYSPINFKSTL